MPQRDLYEILGVGRDATGEEIKKAFRKVALQHHPDRQQDGGEEAKKRAEAVFKEASAAYSVLSDPEQRERYDRYGHAGLGRGAAEGGVSMDDVFSSFGDVFGDGFLSGMFGGSGGARQGAHLQCQVVVSLEEAARGVTRTLEFERPEPCDPCSGTGAKPGTRAETCPTCKGQGAVQQSMGFLRMQVACPRCGGDGERITHPCGACRGRGRVLKPVTVEVRVPPGVDDGSRIRLGAQGSPGEKGAARGDLFCLVAVSEHPLLKRHGEHLVCEVPVSFSQAALGAEVEVPTLDGPKRITVPPGTQPGDILKLKGEGMPRMGLGGSRRGDLLVQVLVEVPRKPTSEQEELLRQYAVIEGRHPSPKQKGFLEALKDYFKDEGKA